VAIIVIPAEEFVGRGDEWDWGLLQAKLPIAFSLGERLGRFGEVYNMVGCPDFEDLRPVSF
jgi:hypothetical protein